jgi:hypothetical protein
MMTIESCAIGLALLSISVVSLSVFVVRKELLWLSHRKRPFGWKYLEDQGPELDQPLSRDVQATLKVDGPYPTLLIYTFGCSSCSFLDLAIPALLEDIPELRVTILSKGGGGLNSPEGRSRTTLVESKPIAKALNFHVAPLAVYLERGIPMRKGLVNSLEQLRLLVDIGSLHSDMQLK